MMNAHPRVTPSGIRSPDCTTGRAQGRSMRDASALVASCGSVCIIFTISISGGTRPAAAMTQNEPCAANPRRVQMALEKAAFLAVLAAQRVAPDPPGTHAVGDPGDEMETFTRKYMILIVSVTLPFVIEMVESVLLIAEACKEFAVKLVQSLHRAPEVPITSGVILRPHTHCHRIFVLGARLVGRVERRGQEKSGQQWQGDHEAQLSHPARISRRHPLRDARS